MKTIRILHMYADMLDLYGDSGNMEVISFRCRKRGIGCQIDTYSIDSEMPDFTSYDLIYIGGGADLEQQHISADLMKCREGIVNSYKNGTFLFLICGGYQLMGQYYRDADGNDIKGLGLFDYFTVAPNSRRKRCIGNIVVETKITGKPVKVVGFENHGGQTQGIKAPFGKVLFGNGNCSKSEAEGYCEKNVIATYLHGPCLSKNPEISDYMIEYCVNRGEAEHITIEALDDTLEKQCRQVMLDRLLKK
ncbi:type 1 glutamine amidotransferase [Ruminococcus flavefaciens]|uniref:type 1 glutamine amidotransferase n=1 Tax=Ruminococcus flavefaciens TaxID=1265 RepID=UPI0026EE1B18|nr:glutamine amidotransferase [Ruminococcus flavefaciens]MDD7517707.1 glutamine amidotransferase [Ruminococcus flavefaciens]MDY5690508.1 glutamine amidotransferase [Ruminococcus flavefaciens]